VLEAPMDFTFQPPFLAGLSGYVAEMASAFVCALLGVTPTVRHADYLASWIEVLRADNRAIFRAASAAAKAADYLLAFQTGSDSADAPGCEAAQATSTDELPPMGG
ncbi:zincin-like metallopeptidase domain-containing protein, partial [Rhizorhabdus dicambivorans]